MQRVIRDLSDTRKAFAKYVSATSPQRKSGEADRVRDESEANQALKAMVADHEGKLEKLDDLLVMKEKYNANLVKSIELELFGLLEDKIAFKVNSNVEKQI